MTEETAVVIDSPEPPIPSRAQLLVGKGGLQFTDLDGMLRFANMVIQTSMCPKDVTQADNPAVEALSRIQMGLEVGLAPMFALRNVAVINGRPCIWGNALRALVQNHPECEEFTESFEGKEDTDEFTAICSIKRKGRTTVHMKFSYKDAKVAGLWDRNVWKLYPKDLARGKAMSRCTQATFADALGGLISEEEARDSGPSAPIDVTPSTGPDSLAQLTKSLKNAKQDGPEETHEDTPVETEEGAVSSEPIPEPSTLPAPGVVAPEESGVDEGSGGEDSGNSYEGYVSCAKCASLFLPGDSGELDGNGLCSDCRPKPKRKRRSAA